MNQESCTMELYDQALQKAAQDISIEGEAGKVGLQTHIVREHFAPPVLAWYGVAQFDILLAKLLRLSALDIVINGAYQHIEGGWPGYQWDRSVINQEACRVLVVKNLICIEGHGLGPIDWLRVNAAIPTGSITFDPDRDSHDPILGLILDHIILGGRKVIIPTHLSPADLASNNDGAKKTPIPKLSNIFNPLPGRK